MGGCWESGRDQRRTMPAGLDWDESDARGDGSWLLLGARSGAKGMESGSKMEFSFVSCHSSSTSRCVMGAVMVRLCYKYGVLVPWVLVY